MIEKLTPDQIQLMTTVRDEWVAKFFSLSFNPVKARQLVQFCYRLANIPEPKIIMLDSPMAVQLAANMINQSQVWDQVRAQVWAQVGDQVRAQVWDQVRAQVRDQVGDQVGAQVWDQVRAQVGAQVRDQVHAQVRDQVGAQVGAQVRDQVWDQVRDQVRDQVQDQVRAQVRDQVGAQVRAQVWAQVGAQKLVWYSWMDYADISNYGWVAHYKYFQQIGCQVPPLFTQFCDLIQANIFCCVMFQGICFISKPPIDCPRDSNHKLHGTIQFGDGWKYLFDHGKGIGYLHIFEIQDKTTPAGQIIFEIHPVKDSPILL